MAGQVTVTRTSLDASQASVTITPKDRLVIGFGNSFTSGEGNPERLALFSGEPWTGGNLPDRDPDPVSLAAKDTRAQWTDRWCHRSVYSWQIRTALAAALSDHQSFTFYLMAVRARQSRRVYSTATMGLNGAPRPILAAAPRRTRVSGNLPARRLPLLLRLGRAMVRSNRRPHYAAGTGERVLCGRRTGPAARHHAVRTQHVFKRSADALLIDIGINDVGFAGWAAGIILQDPLLRSAAGAMTPCFDKTARCVQQETSSRSSIAGTDFCGPFLINICYLTSGLTRRM